MKVGLLFGSFNPVHTGHLILANFMAYNTDLGAVWLVVSPQNPFKASKALLHEFDRYHMVSLAIDQNDRLGVSDIEFKMPRPSYTIDTLTFLQDKYPGYEFVLIMGEDNLPTLPKWKNYERILEYYQVYVYPRTGTPPSALHHHPKVKMVPAPMLDLSATLLRDLVRQGKSITYMVPEAVEEYIRQKKFWI
ncbi:MAG: nicotinate (nicotinamide) nucleotide adenylyltransferase [Adhaeribacter sp.]